MNIEELVLNNLNLAYSIAIKYAFQVKNYCEFEDAVQICYEGLIKAARTYDDTKGVAFSTYAYTVIRNHLITPSIIKKRKMEGISILSLDNEYREDCTLNDIIPDNTDMEKDFEDNDEIKILYECINELPDLYKDILLLRLKGITFKEIAKRLDIGEFYVKQRYQKALNMMRNRFRGKLR